MLFLHCRDCSVTVRHLDAEARRDTAWSQEFAVDEFQRAHAGCRLTRYVPTGRAESTLAWHEPLALRRIEVLGEDGPALAIGRRRDIAAELEWSIEPICLEERLAVELDRPAFWNIVDRALRPHHVPTRVLSSWAARIEDYVRRVAPESLVLLHDDPSHPNVSLACLTLTSRVTLESSLQRCELDEESLRMLRATFDDPEFPPLCVSRRLVAEACGRGSRPPQEAPARHRAPLQPMARLAP